MTGQRVLIDCDPGIDDALAIALAAGSPELEITAITTVCGNVGLDLTTANALRLREYLGIREVPVAAGSPGPILRRRIEAPQVHGGTGLGNARLPAPKLPASDRHAVDLIIETLESAPGEVTLIGIGPLTNIALAVRREPRITDWARRIVIMGGSYTRGNRNPAAEFNMAADPEAAAIVFAAGWTVTMVGLDVTLRAQATERIVERMRALGPLADDLLLPAVEFYGFVSADEGPAIHDACAVAQVIKPELMTCRPAVVRVETAGRWTSGMTVVDFREDQGPPNATVATEIDVDALWDLTLSALARVRAPG